MVCSSVWISLIWYKFLFGFGRKLTSQHVASNSLWSAHRCYISHNVDKFARTYTMLLKAVESLKSEFMRSMPKPKLILNQKPDSHMHLPEIKRHAYTKTQTHCSDDQICQKKSDRICTYAKRKREARICNAFECLIVQLQEMSTTQPKLQQHNLSSPEPDRYQL